MVSSLSISSSSRAPHQRLIRPYPGTRGITLPLPGAACLARHSEKLVESKDGLKLFLIFINALAVSGIRYVSRNLIFI